MWFNNNVNCRDCGIALHKDYAQKVKIFAKNSAPFGSGIDHDNYYCKEHRKTYNIKRWEKVDFTLYKHYYLGEVEVDPKTGKPIK